MFLQTCSSPNRRVGPTGEEVVSVGVSVARRSRCGRECKSTVFFGVLFFEKKILIAFFVFFFFCFLFCFLSAFLSCHTQQHSQFFSHPGCTILPLGGPWACLTIFEKLVKQQYLLYMSSQYGELRPTNGWDRLASLGHPSKFQPVSSWLPYCTDVAQQRSTKRCATFGRLLG